MLSVLARVVRIPPEDAGRPVLPILVDFFCGLMWEKLFTSVGLTNFGSNHAGEQTVGHDIVVLNRDSIAAGLKVLKQPPLIHVKVHVHSDIPRMLQNYDQGLSLFLAMTTSHLFL